MLTKIKTIRSHTGLARLLAECSEEPIGTIERQRHIPRPYAFSPVEVIYSYGEKRIFIAETRHRRFEVYEVPAEMALGAADA